MNKNLDSLRVLIIAPSGAYPLARFSILDSRFNGDADCGICFEGSWKWSIDRGVDVEMILTIPRGARIGSSSPTTEERRQLLNLHLTRPQLEGAATARVLLPGFGGVRLRFAQRAGE